MVFCGTTFIGGKYTSSPTPTGIRNITYVSLANGKYKVLYITRKVPINPLTRKEDPTLEINMDIPRDWDWDTVMRTRFDEGLLIAGNIAWTLNTVDTIVVRRRVQGEYNWLTVGVFPIEKEEDFSFEGVDRFNQSSTTYEYGIVPYLEGNPGAYTIKAVDSEFDSVIVTEFEESYKTFCTDGFIDTTRNIPGTYNVPLISRYPIFFSSGLMNYDSGSVTGHFFALSEDCRILEKYSRQYRTALMDFLTNRKPKILKHPDGRIWLIQVIPSPTDSGDTHYSIRNTTFQWIEIGRYDSNEDLYWSNLLDIPEKWWIQGEVISDDSDN